MTRMPKLLPILLVALLATAAIAACRGDDDGDTAGDGTERVTLRLGYYANVTHAQPLIGVSDGTFAEELGENVKLETKTFNAGPAAIEAIFAGEIDAAYIGPNPAINGYVQSGGKEVRIVSGAASGGASLVVRADSNIKGPQDFKGKKVASPQLGNTQDVALRSWLKEAGLKTKEEGGDVTVLPTANADTLALFKRWDIHAAWVPEPWETRLVQEANGQVLVDERTLWPQGEFVTTHLIVRQRFLEDHPDVVEKLVRANVKVTQWINANPEEAKTTVNQAITEITSAGLPAAVIHAAWENLEFTYDPIASSLKKSADDAYALGFLKEEPDLADIYALDALNTVLASQNLAQIKE